MYSGARLARSADESGITLEWDTVNYMSLLAPTILTLVVKIAKVDTVRHLRLGEGK